MIISPWRKVRELHDSFKHSQSGLGVAAQLIIAILMSAVVGPMAMGAMGGAATSAAATSLATTGAISTINNKGNLGAVARDVTSKDAIKGYAISGITAGLTSGLYDGWTGTETASHATTTTTNTGALTNSATVATTDGLSTWSGIGQFAANQALQNTTSAALGKLLGQGDSFSDALQRTLANTFMAAGFNWVGDVSHGQLDNGSLTKAGLHAVMGGLAAEAMGGDFKTGALAAGVNELVVAELDAQYKKMGVEDRKNLLHMSSQVLGVVTASLQGGDAKAMQVGAAVAGGATAYNYLQHQEPEQLAKALVECRGASNPAECRAEVQGHYWALSDSRHGSKIYRCVEHGVQACSQQLIDALGGSASLDGLVQQTRFTDEERNILLDFQSRNYDDDFTARVAEMQAVGAIATSVIIPAGAVLRRPPGTTENIPKATGTAGAANDTVKALPGPKQIEASWSASTYNKGGLMTGIEHVFYRHGPDSGFSNVSKFSQGTSLKDVSNYVDSALRYGKVSPNGPGGYVIEYNAGKVIGTNSTGALTSTIKVNIRDGVIQTAFPL